MTIVHQAIYGDKEGSYALLETSLTDTELARRICNATDLLDRPSNGYLTQSVFRGFALNDHFIFIKSFPDNDPSVRKGRVLSHVFIIERRDLHQINDLAELFSYFLSKPDKNPKLNSIVIDGENSGANKIVNQGSREAAAINGLLQHSSYNNTLIWIGEENYFTFVTQLWGQLEGNLRAKLNLGVGFNPQKIDTQKYNILYVPENYENKWNAGGFCIVGKKELGTLESMSSFRLAGHKNKSKSLDNLIATFGIVLNEIEDFGYIETAVVTYENLSPKTDFNRLIVLCDLISKYSPDKKIAKKEKHKLLSEVISRISLASAEQILLLKNPEWKGFLNAQQFISDQIVSWVEEFLFDSKVDKPKAGLIIAVAFDPKNNIEWWKQAFSEGLEAVLKNWKPTHAISLWSWFSVDANLVKTLENIIPANAQVEIDFVNHWQKSGQKLAQNIQIFAKDREWLSLHGLVTLQLLSPEESIKKQLEIDTDPEYSVALSRMGELISDKDFIRLTVKIEESRLVKITGEKIAGTPSLISQLDVKNIIWRQIWLESIEQGMQLCDGIKEPAKVLFVLLEELINGVKIESSLLLKFSKSDYNDLSNFKLRSKVWKQFDNSIKSGFINATTFGCIRLLDKKGISVNNFEDDIRVCLSGSTIISQLICDQTISVSTKILLFKELPAFDEKKLSELLGSVHFSPEESKDIGNLIFKNNWNRAAEAVANKIASRHDLKPALKECQSLLGFFEKLRLSLSNHLSNAVSAEEWWSALSEQCYTKYPKGPADKELWGRAGGESYDLNTYGTGREIWMDTIINIRKGSADIDVVKLLQEMSKDYSNSNELKQLKRYINNYEK